MSLVSINLLTYNGSRFIEKCLASVFGQSYLKIEFLIIDNRSQDNTVVIIQEIISRANPKFPVRFIQNDKNTGFAAGHNQGISQSKGEFVLCLNQDAILAPDFVEKAVKLFSEKKDEKIAAIQPKILRLNEKLEPTEIIDTTGLVVLKNRRIIGHGQGQIDKGQYAIMDEIFGVDGAAPIFKREALEDVKLPFDFAQGINSVYEYFDEDFFLYKEDVDLAWRLRLYGWKTFFAPDVKAWHARGAGDSAAINYISIIKERRKISNFAKYLSFRNQRLMQIKNELPSLFLKHSPRLFFKEIGAWVYVILFEHFTLKVIGDLIKFTPKAFRKRKIIMQEKKVDAKEMGRWFV
ncbi:MAG: glycosyltransferase family 2 protein [Candidatus Portnoybacteria bacterium]|nr:glycosyltransferase family 2 protein [Candidatus Portnoybacteria bacterium]